MISSPTGIAADPALTAHGVDQARELAAHLRTLSPPIEQVYSSPYYRCLQTVEPFVSWGQGSSGHADQGGREADGEAKFSIRAETGLGEWYGSAPFEHPTSADPEVLKTLFPAFDLDYRPIARPTRMGETLSELHDRVAATMEGIIAQCDREGTRAILICSHAAVIIALGRVLTGDMPDDVEVEDFGAFTCGLSVFQRKITTLGGGGQGGDGRIPKDSLGEQSVDLDESGNAGRIPEIKRRGHETARILPLLSGRDKNHSSDDEQASHADQICTRVDPAHQRVTAWRGGAGVAGGWKCLVNSECSFLKGGEERGWYVFLRVKPRLTHVAFSPQTKTDYCHAALILMTQAFLGR